MRGTSLSLGVFVLLAAGCGTTGDKKPPPVRTEQDEAKIAEAIKNRQVLYAMTKSEVRRSIGSPIRKKNETWYGKRRQRWDYNSFAVIFDDDGFVVRIEGAGY